MMDYTPTQVESLKEFFKLDKKYQQVKAELLSTDHARESVLSKLDGEFGYDNTYHELKKAQKYFDEFPEELEK